MAIAACGTALKLLLRNAIFGAAVQTADNDIVRHNYFLKMAIILSLFSFEKANYIATLTSRGLRMRTNSDVDIFASSPREPALMNISGKSAMVFSM